MVTVTLVIYLVGKPKPGTGEFVMREPAQQILYDKHLGLLTLGWGGEALWVVKGQNELLECCLMQSEH